MPKTTASFTVTYTPPAALTGLSATVIEELSHIRLDWDATSLSGSDFNRYQVERKLPGSTSWTILATITDSARTYYKDATAGQGEVYNYRVIQYQTIPGDSPIAGEEGDVLTASLESDVWFVIGNENPDDETHAFELPVSGERHTRPIQQEVFEPIARNRKKVARGNVLGYEGTLQIMWTNEERATAKDQLNFLATDPGPHLLKSPFGDVWEVEFDAPDYTYSGGGHLAVEIGWVEVV